MRYKIIIQRYFSLLLVITLLSTIVTMSTIKINATSESDLTFTLSSDGESYSVTDCNEYVTGELLIPTTYCDKPVTAIEKSAFENCSYLTDIIIPSGVKSIGFAAFRNCTVLANISIPNSITSIGNASFYNCSSLQRIIIPDEISIIGAYSFYGCAELTNITIPNSVNSIGAYAFYGCTNLTSVTIPEGVKNINEATFYGCTNLKNIIIPSSIVSIGKDAFVGCESLVYNQNNNALYLGNESNQYIVLMKAVSTDIVSCEVDDNTKFIQSYAFSGCKNLNNIAFPDTIISIGRYAFKDCSSLTNIFIPESVTDIGYAAFSGCGSLKSMRIPFVGGGENNSKYFGSELFGFMFGEDAYEGGSETKQFSGSDMTTIGAGPYYIPTSLTSVTVTGKSISAGAFYNCSFITNVTFFGELLNIPKRTFSGCSSLFEIYIPNTVTTVDSYAFSGCNSLSEVYYEGTINEKQLISISSSNESFENSTWHYNCIDNCIDGSKHLYDDCFDSICDLCGKIREANHDYVWIIDKENNCIDDGVKHEECAICHIKRNENTITKATGEHDYSDAVDLVCNLCGDKRTLESIAITDEPDTLDYLAGTEELDISGGKITLYYSNNTEDIIDITSDMISEVDLSTIGTKTVIVSYEGFTQTFSVKVFSGGTCGEDLSWKLDVDGTLTISGYGSMTDYSSGKAPWYGERYSITKLIVEYGVTNIGSYAFAFCDSLISVKLSNSVNYIGYCAFYSCGHLESIIIPKSVTCISDMGMNGCMSLKHIWYSGTSYQRNSNLTIGKYNDWMHNAKWHYNTCADKHSYSGACDSKCNSCEWTRDIDTVHSYSSSCDVLCNVCGASRYTYADHNYSNACDTRCDKCGASREVTHDFENNCDETCGLCGYTRDSTHRYEWIIDRVSNCGINGIKHEECTDCHAKRNQNTKIDATGDHTFTDANDIECDVCKMKFILIKFDSNGGSNITQIRTIQNESIALSSNCPTRSGYNFAGWATTKNGDIVYNAGAEIYTDKSITLYAQWNKHCGTCYGTGKTKCSTCSGSGEVKSPHKCSSCKGGGYICLSCNRWLYLTRENIHESLYCRGGCVITSSSCGYSSFYKCPYCYSHGEINDFAYGGTNFISCNDCNGFGIEDYATCNSCKGTGKSGCTSCTGTGEVIRSDVSAPSVPVLDSVTFDTVILKSIDNGEYSMDGVTWQDSTIFENLKSGEMYTFYQRYAKTDTTNASASSVALKVNTSVQLLGDVDGDGKVSIMDATMIQRHIAQLATIADDRLVYANTDKDDKISIMDATMIQRFIAQLIPEL